MKFKLSVLLVLLIACGPSEEEIQARVDEAVENALETTTTTKIENTSTTVKREFDNPNLFVLKEEALANAEKLGCPSGAEAKPYKYKDELLYVSSCIKPSFEEFSDFINYYIWLRAGRRLFDSEIKLSYNKHINKTVPDSYYVVKNTLEKDYEREIKSHQKGKSKKEMQSMVLRMMYDQADKQEGESILPENSTNESDSSSQYTEYELGNCQQVGDIYSECTKYVNDAPVSVIFCVYDVCREEY